MKKIISLLMSLLLVCSFTSQSYYVFASSAVVTEENITYYTITTIGGKTVKAAAYGDELPTEIIRYRQNQVRDSFPDVEELDEPTKKYNCHSYAWFESSDENFLWINDITGYLRDDHTRTLSSPTVGCIVVYYKYGTFKHSGIVDSISSNGDVTVISKWGEYGLYRHTLDDLPDDYLENGNANVQYYQVDPEHSINSYTYIDSTSHAGVCLICNRSIPYAHTVSNWESDNPATHSGYCSGCNTNVTQAHYYSTSPLRCGACGQMGPFATVQSIVEGPISKEVE